MASIAISASLHRACSFNHVPRREQLRRMVGTKQATKVVTGDVEGAPKGLKLNIDDHKDNAASGEDRFKVAEDKSEESQSLESSTIKFKDERWKNGTWDLNMFVKDGKMDWDGVIVAEARRRRFLEVCPEAATNEDPVVFRSSIIPWWAWIRRSHLPEAELLNGRAAMLGFFMAYAVDALTGMGVVGQTGNVLCKAGLLATVVAVLFFRRNQDIETLRTLVDEATFYDKQWQASWRDQAGSTSASDSSAEKM
ncbi:hypothetical protein ACJRO7_002929 [Eucalyptus globulus]|uniref:Uncharacterized protein n=1 Tax=Eucalyptus globulus TaxID=34317 RepID=A0ABD3M5X4_EUCGL